MPLTSKGEKIKGAMQKEYGATQGAEVFYASRNKGTITGVDSELPNMQSPVTGYMDAVRRGDSAGMEAHRKDLLTRK